MPGFLYIHRLPRLLIASAAAVIALASIGCSADRAPATYTDGRLAFVANIGSGSVTVIDLERREVIRSIPTGAGAEGVAVTPDGSEVWITNRSANTVTVLDAASLEVLATIPSTDFPIRVVFTPDGKRALVTNARSGQLRIFETATRRETAVISLELGGTTMEGRIFQFEGSAVPIGILVTPDSRIAYIAASNADLVVEIDQQDHEVKRLFPTGLEPDGMALVPRK
ncbi:MAG: cytochrome D1 domain-containing protein [bacterium]